MKKSKLSKYIIYLNLLAALVLEGLLAEQVDVHRGAVIQLCGHDAGPIDVLMVRAVLLMPETEYRPLLPAVLLCKIAPTNNAADAINSISV